MAGRHPAARGRRPDLRVPPRPDRAGAPRARGGHRAVPWPDGRHPAF